MDDSRGFIPDRLDLQTPLVILLSMAGLLLAMCGLMSRRCCCCASAAGYGKCRCATRWAQTAAASLRQLLMEGGLLGAMGAAAGLALSPVLSRFWFVS